MKKRTILKSISVIGILFIAGIMIISFNFFAEVSAQTDEVKEVRDILTANTIAVEKGDLAALDKIWANSDDVTVFESGHANFGWSDYRNNHLAPELKAFKNTKYTFADLKIKVDGKTAWATFKYELKAEIEGRTIQSGGLGTAILEKRDDHWQIVHWHSSATRRQPSPSPVPTK